MSLGAGPLRPAPKEAARPALRRPRRGAEFATSIGTFLRRTDKETLREAPSFSRDETPDWGNRDPRVHA